MSMTAFDEATSKSLEDAGFTDVQIVALSGCLRRPSGSDASIEHHTIARPSRDADHGRGGSIGHAIAMMVLALGGLGALVAILVRVA